MVLLGDGEVAVVALVAQVGQLVFVVLAASALELAGMGEQRTRLAHEVERDVGHRDVFLQHWRVAAPLAQALRQHQAGVADAQQVLHGGRAVQFDRCLHDVPSAHMWSTDFGSA